MSSIDTDKTPADVLYQDVPIAGVVDGQEPTAAVSTVVAGISSTRETPTLRVTYGKLPLTTAGSPQRLGEEPRRRRLLVAAGYSAVAGACLILAENEQQARGGYGYELASGQRVVVQHAKEIWVAASVADIAVSWMQEMDQG